MSKQKALIINTTLERWNDVISLNQEFLKHFIFRGQANYDWPLQTSLERMVAKHHGRSINCPTYCEMYERKMLKEFIWKYPLYEKSIIPDKTDWIEWLSLMQHYGAPTRLLDFTYSLYVALFMCLDDFQSDYCCLWALNKTYLNHHLMHLYLDSKNLTSGTATQSELEFFAHQKANEEIYSGDFKSPKHILVINPNICNERLSIQQGLFLMPTNISCSFQDNLNSSIENSKWEVETIEIPVVNLLNYGYTEEGKSLNGDIIFQFRIKIHHKFKYELCNLLKQMNITAETIYPGITGMAKSLSMIYLHSDEYTK